MKKCINLFTLCLCFVFMLTLSVHASDKGNFSTKPKTNNGKKWRIGFYEGGDYIDYQSNLIATVKGLIHLGWIEQIEIPEQEGAFTNPLWNWLAENVKSSYIEFVKDALIKGFDWKLYGQPEWEALKPKKRNKFIKILRTLF